MILRDIKKSVIVWSRQTKKKKLLNHSAIIIITLTSHGRFDVSNHRQCRQFVQKLLQTGSKVTLKSLHHWPSVRGIHQSPLDSPHEVSVMLKVFPCHDLIICRDILYYFGTPNDAWVIAKKTLKSVTQSAPIPAVMRKYGIHSTCLNPMNIGCFITLTTKAFQQLLDDTYFIMFESRYIPWNVC